MLNGNMVPHKDAGLFNFVSARGNFKGVEEPMNVSRHRHIIVLVIMISFIGRNLPVLMKEFVKHV